MFRIIGLSIFHELNIPSLAIMVLDETQIGKCFAISGTQTYSWGRIKQVVANHFSCSKGNVTITANIKKKLPLKVK